MSKTIIDSKTYKFQKGQEVEAFWIPQDDPEEVN
jgi:hypothetical protein